MLTVQVTRSFGKVVKATVVGLNPALTLYPPDYENRNDWKTFEAAEEVAKALGEGYVATDAGSNCSPRFDVIDLPKVGAAVSYTFNGDYYPCGTIKSISAGPGFRRIVTEDANKVQRVFWRRCRNGKPIGGAWINEETWSLIPGTVDRRNPEF